MSEHDRDLTREEAGAIKQMLFRITQVEGHISEAEDSLPHRKGEFAQLRSIINDIKSAARSEAASDAERASMEHNRELKK